MTQSDISAIRNAAIPLLPHLPDAGWLPHALVRKPDGKLDKPPCEGATSNNPASWFTMERALDKLINSPMVAGIGFAIVKGLIALDFDHCRDQYTGELTEEVQAVLIQCNSFAYITPSRTGIRIVGINDTTNPIPGQKTNRWLPGGHKVELFIGPVNFYNTFTADIIPGYETIRDISSETMELLAFLDAGKKIAAAKSPPATSNPDPQRSIGAITAALAIIPNTARDWDEWCRIGMAVWRASGGRGEGLNAWHAWSAKHDSYDPAKCDERWQHWFDSPPTRIGYGTLYMEARKTRPLFVAPFNPVPAANGHDTDEITAAGETGQPKQPAILTIAELLALPPPQWLVAGLIPEQSLVVPYGPPKSGKSFLMMSVGLHIADGRPWFGHAVQQGAVVYVMGEGIGGMSLRVRAMLKRYDMAPDIPFFIVRRAVNFREPAEVNALEATIRARIGDVPLRMLVVDTLARAMPGADENSAQETGAVIAAADYLKEELRCTVALVHHEGKDGSRGARGTSALRGAWDAAYQIVSHGKRMTVTVVDQKEAEAGQVLRFIMEEVAVGIGRTSLVPVLDETAGAGEHDAGQARREIGGHAGLMLAVLRQAMKGPDVAMAGTVKRLTVEVWRRGIYEKMPGVEADARRQAFHRGMQTLMQKGLINVKDPWVWLCDENEA